MTFEVQSVIFNKSKWTPKKAEEWLKKHNYKTSFYGKKVDITANFYRYRQTAPKYKSYRMKPIGNEIMLVLGYTGKGLHK